MSYVADFMHMLFAVPSENYQVNEVVERALNLLLILHADHEQNCSTSTVRMVGSSQADLFASIGAGVSVCQHWRGRLCTVGAAARRCQPGSDRDAADDPG